jgi:hypothetical protein
MTAAARPQQASASIPSTSLSRYATAKSPNVDLYNGSTSRDYCNSFWGVGTDGVNILLARMRGALRTTEELRNFWNERSVLLLRLIPPSFSHSPFQISH